MSITILGKSTQTITNKPLVASSAILSRVGNTPLLQIQDTLTGFPDGFQLFGKAEWYNPAGSVKDRPAAQIMRQALDSGQLEGGKTFLDSSSGNMGIAYATIGASLGIPVHLVIPENAGPERIGRLRALGVPLTLSDPLEGSDGAHEVATGLAASEPHKFFFADQYNNPANWQAHFGTTGPELWAQMDGEISHFIAGLGTTGTITGTASYLKQQDPGIQVIAVQPDSPLHGLEGLKHLESSPIPGIFNEDLINQTIEVATEETYSLLRELSQQHGLLLGISSAAAIIAAKKLAREVEMARAVVILPDSGEKYLSQPFWFDK